MFDRYKESNDDYRVQARKITFGLKKNTNLRERLISGALHGLELVYADDKVRIRVLPVTLAFEESVCVIVSVLDRRERSSTLYLHAVLRGIAVNCHACAAPRQLDDDDSRSS